MQIHVHVYPQCLFPGVILALMFDLSSSSKASEQFSLNISPDGGYSIAVGSSMWLESAPTWFIVDKHKHSTSDKTLDLIKTAYDHGVDNIGSWNSTVFTYSANKSKFLATIGKYQGLPFVFFGQVKFFILKLY